jgi:hypothetical protein
MFILDGTQNKEPMHQKKQHDIQAQIEYARPCNPALLNQSICSNHDDFKQHISKNALD